MYFNNQQQQQQQKFIQNLQKIQQQQQQQNLGLNQLQYLQMQNQSIQQQQLQMQQQQYQQQIQLRQFQQQQQQLQQFKQQQIQQMKQQQQQQIYQQMQQYQLLNQQNTLTQYQNVAAANPAAAAAAALQTNSVAAAAAAAAAAKNNALQQLQQQPAQFQKVIQQQQALNSSFVNDQDWKTKNKQKIDEQRKLCIQEIVKRLMENQNLNLTQVNSKALLETATKIELQIFTKASSFEEYKAIITNQLLHPKNGAAIKNNMQVKVQQPATLATHNTTPQLQATNLATSASLQTRPQIAQPVAVANTVPKTTAVSNEINQPVQLQQATLQNQTHTQGTPQTPSQAATKAINKANDDLTAEQKEEMIKKIENAQQIALKLKKIMQIVNISDAKVRENLLNTILLVQRQYECRKEKFIMENNIFERIEKNLHVYYDNLINQFKQKKIQIGAGNANAASQLTNSLASAQQARIQQIHQIQAHLAAQKAQTQASTQAQLSKKAQVNNQAAVKVEATIPDTINNTPNIQPKSLTETIKTEAKNLKASSSEVFTNEDNKQENDKTTTSSSTKKRNNRKTNTTSSSSVSSINNLSSKKSESSSTESGSKKLANSSKDQVKLEKDDSFLGKINRNINIFALESKNYKTHIKSNSKTRNIIQNSFKYIIDPNHPAYGINSCAEEISSLCFQSNNIERKTKPLKLENINDSSNDHISLFEDIINRKSHIITSENDNDNKKPQTNKMIADDNERNKVGTKRKFDEMTNTDSIIVNNSIKKATVKDKYSSIIDEINFLKDKYKINVNIVDTSNISLLLKEKENKSGEIPWNDFINMINIIKKEEYQDTTENHTLMNINYNDTSIKQKNAQQKINNERVMLVISLNLSNYIDTTEVENEYNIPGDNQNNIVIYARIPKSTQRYSLQGIFDWSLLYTKKKSIFQNSEEDNKLKEKKIYDFISHKLHDQDETSAKEKINMDIENKHPITISNRVIKVYNIVEWIVEGIKS